MTDNEIIKALERSVEQNIRKNASCDGCSYEKVFPYCHSECSEDTLEVMYLDLINRLKAENERLQKAIAVIDIMEDQHKYDLKKAKAEVIKEYAERLNKEAEKVYIDREGDFVEADGEIYDTVADWCKKTSDNIVKEMVGDNE